MTPANDLSRPERMTASAREALYEAINTRRLIAFVGSGMSLVYSQPTWNDFIRLMVERLKQKAAEATPASDPTTRTHRAQRIASQIKTLEAPKYDDPVVILELVRRAFEDLDGLRSTDPRSSYLQAMEDIFVGRWGAAKKQFERRFDWATAHPNGTLSVERPEHINNLSNREALEKICDTIAIRVPGIDRLAQAINAEPHRREEDHGLLPTDRRSLITPILAIARTVAACDPTISIPWTGSNKKDIKPPLRPLLDPISELHEWFGIRRFMTTNYDLELEKLLMFSRQTCGEINKAENSNELREILSRNRLSLKLDGAQISITHPDGVTVRSDSRDGKHIAPFVEFALGSVDTSIHILHHHGRVDLPQHLIAADGEYNRMYRALGEFTKGQERAYDLLVEGNPVAFVGSGMTEAELNRTLRTRVSNPGAPSSPVFVLREATGTPRELAEEQFSLAVKLGVHVIHVGHPRRGSAFELRKHLRLIDGIASKLSLERRDSDTLPEFTGWQTLVPKSEAMSFDKFTADDASRLIRDNFALFWSLDFDRHMISFLASQVQQNADWIRRARDDENCRALFVEYLSRLALKVRSAALRHELRQLGYEAREFHGFKSTLIDARVVGTVNDHLVRHISLGSRNSHIIWKARAYDPTTGSPLPAQYTDVPEDIVELLIKEQGTAVVVIGDRGSGKGTLLEEIARKLSGRSEKTLTVNCAYGQEADSVISLITDFLSGDQPMPKLTRRERLLRSRQFTYEKMEAPTVVLGAVDRLFGTDDVPLAAEFEWLLQELLHPARHARVVIIGSLRARGFLTKLIGRRQAPMKDGDGPPAAGEASAPSHLLILDNEPRTGAAVGYLKSLATGSDRQFDRHDGARRGDASLRRSVAGPHRLVDAVVGGAFANLRGQGPRHADERERRIGDIALEIMRAMAFIGLPIDACILPSVPRIAALKPQEDDLASAVTKILTENLALAIEPYRPEGTELGATMLPEDLAAAVMKGEARLVLHRLISQVLRERHGIPNNETVLSDSYNISLYAAQPDDAATPDTDVTSELEQLADHLMHAYRDAENIDQAVADAKQLLIIGPDKPNPICSDLLAALKRKEDLALMKGPLFAAGARAAGGVIRGYLSAVNLLSFDRDDPRSRTRYQSVGSAQKRRIRRLLDIAIDGQTARGTESLFDSSAVVAVDPDGVIGQQPLQKSTFSIKPDEFSEWTWSREDLDTLEAADRALGQARTPAPSGRPFYDAEIVWLLNERAMLSLAQGDLYAASTTFRLAFAANEPIEGNRYHPNRCRLLLNRSILWIERGRIADARRCLEELKAGLVAGTDALSPSSREGKLVTAIATGYVGLCDQLNGLAAPAQENYCAALKELQHQREQRAMAIFDYHLGTLLQSSRAPTDHAAPCFARAIEAAEGGRHIDVLYRIRVAKAVNDLRHGLIRDREAMLILDSAVDYGRKLEMHRVSVEALSARALLRLRLGDSDAAGVDCKDALAIAARNGMTLRRISLRIVAGQIYERRRDVANAKMLFRAAIDEATHYGFSRASEIAGTQLMLLGGA